MSDEPKLLQEYISDAIAQYCAMNGFGYPSAFVYCVSRIDSDGEQVLTIGEADGQQTWQSLGLTAFLTKWFADDAYSTITRTKYAYDEEND